MSKVFINTYLIMYLLLILWQWFCCFLTIHSDTILDN